MTIRPAFAFICSLLVPSLSLAEHRLPEEFTPVDTSRVLGSPDRLPLEAEVAFAKLRFERPCEITHSGDGSNRLFVAEQHGVIRVFDHKASSAGTFLDIREVVLRAGNEEGLLGLAFHPKFKQNGEFFVYYTTKPRSSVISRFRVMKDNPDRADRDSEEKLLVIPQPYENHNGGSMKFGPDGFLYIGLGDGGLRDDPHDNAQNLATLLGSILRIDVDHKDEGLAYAIPKDNPFVGHVQAGRESRGEIWAFGFRNVWRIAFDRETGDLWAADVGQDRYEEVNRVERGGNYGWSIREGKHDFRPHTPAKPEGLIDPLAEYARGEGGSVTGGVVYRGMKLSDYIGAYFYADYLSGNVWALWLDDAKKLKKKRQVARTELGIAAFGEDEAGEMYLCAFDGHIYRLKPRAIDVEAVAAAFPRKLSETGLFASVAENEPVEGLIPYELNLPFWSDYAVKDRYLALPKAGKVKFDEQQKWEFPVGTVFVKTFWMHRDRVNMKDPLRLETRLLVNGSEGWVGYTYVYNDDRSEAFLLDEWMSKAVTVKTTEGDVDQKYYFPSRTDCLACHTKAEGFVLGLNTRQMNRKLRYHGASRQQIDMLSSLGVFAEKPAKPAGKLESYPDWGFGNLDRSGDNAAKSSLDPPKGDVEKLARAWLDVNCASCHRPGGIAPGGRDLRYHTPQEKMNVVDQAPQHHQLHAEVTLLVEPGKPHQSELLFRIGRRGPRQMPPLATHAVEERGYEVVRKWIAEMKKE